MPTYLDEGMSDAACKMLCASNSFVGMPVSGAGEFRAEAFQRRGDDTVAPEEGPTGAVRPDPWQPSTPHGGIAKPERSVGDRVNGDGGGGGGAVRRYDVGLAKARLDRCVVGLLEDWEGTKAVMKHWFPWMHFT